MAALLACGFEAEKKAASCLSAAPKEVFATDELSVFRTPLWVKE